MALATYESNMEETNAASERRVHQSQSLCPGELEYINKRKQIIHESLNKLGITCSEDSVPHIALLASGGGQRAAVGLVGSLCQMVEDDLLDLVLYLGGVSGSTWPMASLYSNEHWTVCPRSALALLTGPGVELEDALAWLGKRAEEEDFSLTDIWAVLTSAGIMKEMDLRCLSEEANRKATNPYPVYCAVERHCFSHGPLEGQWFEVTPHEAGFPELDLFVQTSLLGSKFEKGELLEEKPEMDMVKLQGVFGSALAHGDTVKGYIPLWLNVPDFVDSVAAEYLQVYQALKELIPLLSNTVKDTVSLSALDVLLQSLDDTDKLFHDESSGAESRSSDDQRSFFQQSSLQLLDMVERWSDSLEDGDFKTQVSFIIKQLLPLILRWDWGTTNNFLYQYQNSKVPEYLHTSEKFNLIDAGLFINVGYPSFLGDKRDIDLMIVLENSAGDMFETLIQGRDYAAQVKKPFPKIDDKVLEAERDFPKDCYVFEGKKKEPTIVYLPLFNRHNCKDAAEVTEKISEFTTIQHPLSLEKIEFVLQTAKENMRRNKYTLLSEINKAAKHRKTRQRNKTSVQQRVSESCLFGLV